MIGMESRCLLTKMIFPPVTKCVILNQFVILVSGAGSSLQVLTQGRHRTPFRLFIDRLLKTP